MSTGQGSQAERPDGVELPRSIAATAFACPVDQPVVEPQDVDALRRILADRRSDPGVDRVRVVRALARSDRSPATAQALARVAADADESVPVRTNAAAGLATLAPDVVEGPLLDLLGVSDARVKTQVLKALSQVGSARSLAVLEASEPEDERSGRRLLATRLAIGMRAGRALEELDALRAQLGMTWQASPTKPLASAEVARAVERLVGTQNLELDRSIGLQFEVDCENEPHLLLINAELAGGDVVEALLAQRRHAAVVATRSIGDERPRVRFNILTTPGDGAVEFVVATPDGEPAYAGRGTKEDGGLRFVLRDVREPTPTEITGTVGPRSVAFELRMLREAAPEPRKAFPATE
jgi:hypothetical protein